MTVLSRSSTTLRMLMIASMSLLAACALPRSGPNKNEIFNGAVERGGNTQVIYVNDHVNRTANFAPSYGFSSTFQSAGQIGRAHV